jgi:choline dehydrogenase-like flavoprotein
VVVLSAGGIGTAQILKATGLPACDRLWVDVVLTVGGVLKGSRMLNEVPMAWYIKEDNYILAPYFDLLSYWFYKPWKTVSAEDRVGMMIKLADTAEGKVEADGTVTKTLTQKDKETLQKAKEQAKQIMQATGVAGPFVDGMVHGGHLGGTVPLTKADVASMHPSWLPRDLWVADLSLLPKSQGLPAMLTTMALSLRVARKIIQEKGEKNDAD